jgi:plasmid stabilization system protein ParE
MKVRYRRLAQLDIENIYDYIKDRNERAATEVIARIRYAVDRLGMWPHIGHHGRVEGTYEFLVPGLPYIIVYAIYPEHDVVSVIAIFHVAQHRQKQ